MKPHTICRRLFTLHRNGQVGPSEKDGMSIAYCLLPYSIFLQKTAKCHLQNRHKQVFSFPQTLLGWRNWQTRTVEGRVGKPVRVRLPPRVLKPVKLNHRLFCAANSKKSIRRQKHLRNKHSIIRQQHLPLTLGWLQLPRLVFHCILPDRSRESISRLTQRMP